MNERQAYYIRDDDPVYLRLRIMGMLSTTRTITSTIRVFVDDHIATLHHDGVEAEEVRVELVDGIAEAYITISSEQFPEGLSRLTLYDQRDQGEPRPYFHPFGDESLGAITVMKNTPEVTTTFVDSEGYQSADVVDGYPQTLQYFHEESGDYRELINIYSRPNSGAPIRVRLRVQSLLTTLPDCGDAVPDMQETSAFIAMLDGQQVPLGGEPAIITTLGRDEARVFEFEVDLPEDGLPHRYEILRLGGLGQPRMLRGRRAGFSPWEDYPWAVGIVMYGDERYCPMDPEEPDRSETWCFEL